MKIQALVLAALAVAVSGSGLAAPPVPPTAPSHAAPPLPPVLATTASEIPDLGFLALAHRVNQQETAAAQLALSHSRDVRVRQFAQRLIDDHAAADAHVRHIAEAHGVSLPSAVDLARSARLQRLRGAAFDRQFIADARCSQREAIASFRQEIDDGPPGPVLEYAAATLGTMEQHLASAQALHAQFELRRRNAPSGTVAPAPAGECTA